MGRHSLARAALAGQLDVLCDDPSFVCSEFAPEVVHDGVRKEFEPILLVAVGEDSEESRP